jgi:hypothetical protein
MNNSTLVQGHQTTGDIAAMDDFGLERRLWPTLEV